ncbi:MAG: hypothetical protein ABSE84_00540 [Isosphaeraceae bacterium]|jgi:hypothetical protein
MGKRGKIVGEIERQINRLDNRPGLCLFYAHHTAAVLWRHGQRAVIQAGSLQWPRVRYVLDHITYLLWRSQLCGVQHESSMMSGVHAMLDTT